MRRARARDAAEYRLLMKRWRHLPIGAPPLKPLRETVTAAPPAVSFSDLPYEQLKALANAKGIQTYKVRRQAVEQQLAAAG